MREEVASYLVTLRDLELLEMALERLHMQNWDAMIGLPPDKRARGMDDNKRVRGLLQHTRKWMKVHFDVDR